MLSQTFLHLVNVSIMASWLVLAIVLFRLVFKKAPKYIICALWALVAVRLIFPISLESSLSLIPSKETIPLEIEYSPSPAIDTGIESLNTTVNPIIQNNFTPSDELTSMNPIQLPIHIGAYLWQLGVIAMALYALLSYLRIRFKVRESVKLEGNIYLCDHIPSPFILGIIRPKIYLPSHLSEEDASFVIAHEKAHIKRLDYIWKPLGYILLTFYWFNPVLWLGYILLCRDIEYACDEKVVRDMSLDVKKSYSETLLNLSIHRPYVTACPLAFGESGVKGRIKSVLNYKKPAFWIIVAAIALCIAMAVCFLTNPVTKSFASDTSSPFVTYHKGKLYFNCLDGIYSCDENFENVTHLTEGYCDYSFVDNYVLYCIGESFENTTSIEAINLKTLTHKELYSSKDFDIYYLAPMGKDFIFADGDNLITMNSKGEILSSVVFDNSYVAYSNDDFLLYTTNKNTEIRKYDFETGESESVFTLGEGSLGWTVDYDGKYVYYTHVNESKNSFCRYNMKNGKTEVLLEEGFGWEFVIDGNMCYFGKGMNNSGEDSLYAFNIKSKKLTAIPCPDAGHVTGLQLMGDYIVINSGNSSDHILSMQNLRDNTFSYIYHELEEKAGEALVVQSIEISAGTYFSHNSVDSRFETAYVTLEDDGTCSFAYSNLASYIRSGNYHITDTELLINSEGDIYIFDIIENGVIFNSEKSTQTYTEYFPDGAVFTKSEYLDLLAYNQITPTDWKEGLNDDVLKEYYKEDISDVMSMTEAKHIVIRYFDYDLNSDGLTDKFVIVASPIHSGSSGDSVDILINNGDGTYKNVSHYVMQILNQDTMKISSPIYISTQANGYHDIILIGEKTYRLTFDGDRYISKLTTFDINSKINNAELQKYIGEYLFEETWKSTSGIPASNSYLLTIYEENGFKAKLIDAGYQTFFNYTCDVKLTDKGATLYLKEYSDDTVRPHEIGTELLSIKINSDNEILTSWGAVRPALLKNEETPYCFERDLEEILFQLVLETENKVSDMFENKYNSDISWHTDEGVEVIALDSEYNSFEKAYTIMADYCSKDVFLIYLHKNYYDVNENGRIGLILADGEMTFDYYNRSNFNIIQGNPASQHNVATAIFLRYCDNDHSVFQEYLYTFEKQDNGKFIITNIVKWNDRVVTPVEGVW